MFNVQRFVYRAVFDSFTSRSSQILAATPRQETDMCKELKTKVLRLLPQTLNGPIHQRDESHADGADVLGQTVKALQEGHVVALPTDTIYGLACLAQNSEAVCKIYNIKGRNEQKPLAICVGEVQDIKKYCKVQVDEELLQDLLPGPVTLVFERTDLLNRDLNPFTSLVGVRIPDHPFMRRLCQMCGEPLALTSANISSQNSTVAALEFKELWPKLAVVVDGGPIGDQSRLGSTVVDLSTRGKYRIIRTGCNYGPCWIRLISGNLSQGQWERLQYHLCALPSTLDVLQHKYGLSAVTLGE